MIPLDLKRVSKNEKKEEKSKQELMKKMKKFEYFRSKLAIDEGCVHICRLLFNSRIVNSPFDAETIRTSAFCYCGLLIVPE